MCGVVAGGHVDDPVGPACGLRDEPRRQWWPRTCISEDRWAGQSHGALHLLWGPHLFWGFVTTAVKVIMTFEKGLLHFHFALTLTLTLTRQIMQPSLLISPCLCIRCSLPGVPFPPPVPQGIPSFSLLFFFSSLPASFFSFLSTALPLLIVAGSLFWAPPCARGQDI